eukprot:4305678-Alexandrium_andersonii.AAC.1
MARNLQMLLGIVFASCHSVYHRPSLRVDLELSAGRHAVRVRYLAHRLAQARLPCTHREGVEARVAEACLLAPVRCAFAQLGAWQQEARGCLVARRA